VIVNWMALMLDGNPVGYIFGCVGGSAFDNIAGLFSEKSGAF
jgi:hypothetical protein